MRSTVDSTGAVGLAIAVARRPPRVWGTRVPDLVLYDGDCGLCDRLNRFILRRDARGRFRFAPLQSALGAALLRRHGRDARALDTVCVVVDHGGRGERLLSRGRAVLFVLRSLGGAWRLAAGVLGLFPARALDAAYDLVAARRYRWFGRADSCAPLEPEQRSRFIG